MIHKFSYIILLSLLGSSAPHRGSGLTLLVRSCQKMLLLMQIRKSDIKPEMFLFLFKKHLKTFTMGIYRFLLQRAFNLSQKTFYRVAENLTIDMLL
jgi:hypothetical protein